MLPCFFYCVDKILLDARYAKQFLGGSKKSVLKKKQGVPTMGLEPTILPLGGARLIHLATQASRTGGISCQGVATVAAVVAWCCVVGTLAEWLRR